MASISLPISIVTPDGAVSLVAGPADFIKLERKYGIGAAALKDEPRIEYLAFLAWSALRRTREGVPEFDPWFDSQLLELDSGTDDGEDAAAPKGEPAPSSP